jgi:hypothetical protein
MMLFVFLAIEANGTPLMFSGYHVLVALPIFIYVMFGLFHFGMISAKTLTTIELKREVTFSDYAVNFFLFTLLLPVGIWILQPKINRLIAAHEEI